jgi:hypothetical protein
MKPAEARRLARDHTADQLEQAAAELAEDQNPTTIEVRGEDHGEMLTHVLLAQRIRARLDEGEELKTAFRAVMGEVRGVLTND